MEIGIYDAIAENDGNIVHLVETIFSRALQMGASDIHFEPMENYSRIRVRLDGMLVELCRVPIRRHSAVLSRIKLLSELDIAEKRIPQDGRLTISFNNRIIDMRISTLPTICGEKLAIRILDKKMNVLNLQDLDFNSNNYDKYNKLIHSANGLVLVTGPTGSGKTTTLYTTLNHINSIDKNIVTVEDPVEYELSGINQVAINKKIGMDFSNVLRALVRQDPNIIMLGEIRDRQSAEMAIHAALTGHLVFSTLHTKSALGAIARLIDMGIEPFLVVASLRGVLAQRLVRRVCPRCGKKHALGELEKKYITKKWEEVCLVKGDGCDVCYGTGYKGRISIHELIVMDDKLAGMILNKDEESKQLDYIRSQGSCSLKEDGIQKALQGKTSIEELIRTALL